MKKGSKKPVRARRAWPINPKTRIKESAKLYKRARLKEEAKIFYEERDKKA